jgi:hypothetical protein
MRQPTRTNSLARWPRFEWIRDLRKTKKQKKKKNEFDLICICFCAPRDMCLLMLQSTGVSRMGVAKVIGPDPQKFENTYERHSSVSACTPIEYRAFRAIALLHHTSHFSDGL